MKPEQWDRIDAALQMLLDDEQVDLSTFSSAERELLDRLQRSARGGVPGLDTPPAEHEALVAGLMATLSRIEGIEPGATIGPFRIIEPIGSGGMGVVFLAERIEAEFDQRVALKLLGGSHHDPALFQLFQRERALLAQLEHPNIARLIDGGATESNRPWFAMEYIDGEPLDRYANRRRLSVKARIRLFLQACSGLDHAHRQLILHRDIKPANLLVSGDDALRVVDFGLGRVFDPARPATETTIAAGRMTPRYASPEQARGEPIGVASEVYQLGLVLHTLLTDQLPYEIEQGTVYEAARTISEARIQRPSERWRSIESKDATADSFGDRPKRICRALRGDLDNIVLKALAQAPGDRYASVAELADDLCRHLDRLPVRARAATRRYRLSRFAQRHKAAVAGVSAFFGLLLASVVLLSIQAGQLANERDKAVAASTLAGIEADKAGQVTDFLVRLFEAADPAEALGTETPVGELLERGLIEIDALDQQPRIKAEMLRILGVVSASLGEYEQAGSIFAQAVEVLGNDPRDYQSEVSEVLLAQARNFLKLGDYGQAEAVVDRVLEIDVPETDATARALFTRADAQRYTGRLDAAGETLENLIKTRTGTSLDAFDGRLANSLAVVYARQSMMSEAIEQFRRALEIFRDRYGDEHPESTNALGNLGTALLQTGRTREGIDVIGEALEIETRVLGPDHPDLAALMHMLGMARMKLGDLQAAEEHIREAMELRRAAFGERHPETIATLYTLSTLLSQQGNNQQARELMLEVLEGRQELLGPRHRQIANALHAIGVIDSRLERFQSARERLEQALAMRLTLLGEDHMELADSHIALARLALDEGRKGDGRSQLENAERIARKNLPPEHPIFASLAELATSLDEL